MKLHAHGVVRSTHPLPPDAPVRLVTWQDLAVVVSDLPDGRSLSPREALPHFEMLSGLVSAGPVVPLRFGTVAADENAVRSNVLLPAAAQLRTQLDQLDGLLEVHICLRFDEDTALTAVLDQHQSTVHYGRLGMTDQIKAGERIAQQVVAWRRERATTILAPISALALRTAHLPEQEYTEERCALLVPQHHMETVRTAVAELAEDDVTVDFVGPLPAFSFLTPVAESPAAEPPASRWSW